MLEVSIGAVLGLLFGSLIKCLADRSTTKESFFTRSHCDRCNHPLHIIDLIPILSYFLTHGKCRYCHKKITPTLYIYELLTAGIFATLFYLYLPPTIFTSFDLFVVSPLLDLGLKIFAVTVFMICLITDIQTGLIPNRITYPAVVIALIYQIIATISKIGLLYFSLSQSVLGKFLMPPKSDYFYRHAYLIAQPLGEGLIAGTCLGLFFLALIILTRGKGMGGGDLKLSIFLGLALGLLPSLSAMMIAFILGSIFGVTLILIGKKSFGQTIPFGPFISIGGILTILWGSQIVDWYLQIGH